MQFLNIPANYDFLKSLYLYIKNNFKNDLQMSKITILMPSRYSSNELKRVFLENSDGESLILPTIRAIGDIDYDDLLLNGINLDTFNVNALKTTSNVKYNLLLIKELLKNQQNINMTKAITLAQDLDYFLNEVEKNNLSLDNLNNVVDDDYSQHWQKILDFIKVFGKKWQKFLSENNIISNNFHSLEMIKAYTELIKKQPPEYPIIVAGNFLSVKNTAELVKSLAKYDNTYFIFKGFESKLTREEFENLDYYYSHYFFKNIVKELSINLKNIKTINFAECKVVNDVVINTLNEAMLPAHLTYLWHCNNVNKNLDNVDYLEGKSNFDELNLIAFYIVDFFKKNGVKNVALISNGDDAHEMEMFFKKWNLPVNNNFGINFLSNELVKYLFLVVNSYQNNFSVEFLLSLLKNNYTTFGYNKSELNGLIELFESEILNNNEISIKNLDSYRKQINKLENNKKQLCDFIDRIEYFFDDFKNINGLNFSEILSIHLKVAEKIAGNTGNNGLFYNKKNEKIAEYIKEILEQGDCFENIGIDDYFSLLFSLFANHSYRENYTLYPAINIITAEESRLVNYDLVIIPHLNDGVFPKNIGTDPYMSRSMRIKFGLPPKEIEIGKYCYDFIQLLSQKKVLLTRSEKNGSESTIKSRFLQKLEICLATGNKKLNVPENILESYKIYINREYNQVNNKYKIAPCPKPKEKLTKLSATNFDVLVKNPYEIYAKKILNLFTFDIITEKQNKTIIGTIVHKIIELYCKNYENYVNNSENINNLINNVLSSYDNEMLIMFYQDKIKSIIDEFIKYDAISRDSGYSVSVEEKKSCFLGKEDFTLYATIDRIEQKGNSIKIIDYKTGKKIEKKEVTNGSKLQLPIEAIILMNLNKSINIEALQYWMTKYKRQKYSKKQNYINEVLEEEKDGNELIEKAKKYILQLLKIFNVDNKGYFATAKNMEYGNYNLLSRVKEWE